MPLYDFSQHITFRQSKMPLFVGHDPDAWIYKVENFFALREVAERTKLRAMHVSLGGTTLVWLQTEEKKRPFTSSTDLKLQLQIFQDPDSQVYSIKFLPLNRKLV